MTDQMRVHPLYQHIFPPDTAPTLAFIGLLWKSVRNPQFEYQVSAAWSQMTLSICGTGWIQAPSESCLSAPHYRALSLAAAQVSSHRLLQPRPALRSQAISSTLMASC